MKQSVSSQILKCKKITSLHSLCYVYWLEHILHPLKRIRATTKHKREAPHAPKCYTYTSSDATLQLRRLAYFFCAVLCKNRQRYNLLAS